MAALATSCALWLIPSTGDGGRDRLELRVRKGAVIERSFQAHHQMDVVRRVLTHNKTRFEDSGGPRTSCWEMQRRVVTDRVLAVREGGPALFVRRLEKLAVDTASLVHGMDVDAEEIPYRMFGVPPDLSPHQGRSIRFDLDDDRGAFAVTFDGGEHSGDSVEGFVADMDLRTFLPDGEVAEGDSWSLAEGALSSIVAPGGPMGIDMPPGPVWVVDRIPAHLWVDELEGRLTATHAGVIETEGVRLARVRVAGTIETRSSRQAGPDRDGLWTRMEYAARARYELAGELLWDLEVGGMRSLELSGPCEVEKSLRTTFDWMGMENEDLEELELEGKSTFTASRTLRWK